MLPPLVPALERRLKRSYRKVKPRDGRTAGNPLHYTAFVLAYQARPAASRWGREGHGVVALIAEDYITGAAKAAAAALLDGGSIEAVANSANDSCRDLRESVPWHFINSPLTHCRIVLVRDCSQSTWNTSCMSAHHSPSARVAIGCCMGFMIAHHSWVVGSAAIFAISASKSSPTYSK